MFTDPVEPVEVSFYWPKAVLGNFYWPGISSSLLLSSPGSGTDFIHQVPSSQFVLSTSYHLMHFSSDFIHQVGDWNWGILRYFVWSSSHICNHFSSDIFIRWGVLNQVALSSTYVQTTSYHCIHCGPDFLHQDCVWNRGTILHICGYYGTDSVQQVVIWNHGGTSCFVSSTSYLYIHYSTYILYHRWGCVARGSLFAVVLDQSVFPYSL